MFEAFEHVTIVNLNEELKNLTHDGCLQHVHQGKQYSLKIKVLEERAKSWIYDLTQIIKGLVEIEIDQLANNFQATCERVNDEKIKSRGW